MQGFNSIVLSPDTVIDIIERHVREHLFRPECSVRVVGIRPAPSPGGRAGLEVVLQNEQTGHEPSKESLIFNRMLFAARG